MLRRALGLVAALTLTGGPAVAQERSIEVKPLRPSEVRVGIEERQTREASESEARPRRARRWIASTPRPPKTYIADVAIRVLPDGSRCAYIFMTEGDPNSSEAANNEATAIRLATEYGTCPNSPRQANGALTPAAAAALIWEDTVELPDPQLQIKPGYAITGKPIYLEITSPRTIRTTTTAFGHAVELTVTSVLDIDWGDGTPVERNVTRQGGPWPTGDITHVYTDTTNQAPVRVTQRWKASWRVGSQTGVIADQLFTESTLLLPVRELQAVRER